MRVLKNSEYKKIKASKSKPIIIFRVGAPTIYKGFENADIRIKKYDKYTGKVLAYIPTMGENHVFSYYSNMLRGRAPPTMYPKGYSAVKAIGL